jgi:hypothetical protein
MDSHACSNDLASPTSWGSSDVPARTYRLGRAFLYRLRCRKRRMHRLIPFGKRDAMDRCWGDDDRARRYCRSVSPIVPFCFEERYRHRSFSNYFTDFAWHPVGSGNPGGRHVGPEVHCVYSASRITERFDRVGLVALPIALTNHPRQRYERLLVER